MKKLKVALIIGGALFVLSVLDRVLNPPKPPDPDCPICGRESEIPGQPCWWCSMTMPDGRRLLTKPGLTAYARR